MAKVTITAEYDDNPVVIARNRNVELYVEAVPELTAVIRDTAPPGQPESWDVRVPGDPEGHQFPTLTAAMEWASGRLQEAARDHLAYTALRDAFEQHRQPDRPGPPRPPRAVPITDVSA